MFPETTEWTQMRNITRLAPNFCSGPLRVTQELWYGCVARYIKHHGGTTENLAPESIDFQHTKAFWCEYCRSAYGSSDANRLIWKIITSSNNTSVSNFDRKSSLKSTMWFKDVWLWTGSHIMVKIVPHYIHDCEDDTMNKDTTHSRFSKSKDSWVDGNHMHRVGRQE